MHKSLKPILKTITKYVYYSKRMTFRIKHYNPDKTNVKFTMPVIAVWKDFVSKQHPSLIVQNNNRLPVKTRSQVM